MKENKGEGILRKTINYFKNIDWKKVKRNLAKASMPMPGPFKYVQKELLYGCSLKLGEELNQEEYPILAYQRLEDKNESYSASDIIKRVSELEKII